jgi:hypothetical protein
VSIGWAQIEAAIAKWIREGGGLAVGRVIWGDQGGKRPELPYVSILVEDTGSPGHDWKRKSYDSATDQLVIRHQGHRTAMLSIQCFGVPDGGPPSLGKSPLGILTDVVSSLGVHEYDIDVAGAGIGNVGNVKLIQGSRGSILEPRAQFEMQLHLGSEVEQRTDYVRRISMTVNVKNVADVSLAVSPLTIIASPDFNSDFSNDFEG